MAARLSPVFLAVLRASVALPAVVALTPAAYAQDVTGTVRGQVADDSGRPVAGATVTITHVPSGTRSVVTSDSGGGFSAANLRIGGPFEIVVAAPGYDTAVATITNITAGEPQRVAVFLVAEGQTIEVVGTRAASAIQLTTGPAFSLTADDIRDIATVNRDVRTLAARSPYVSLDPTNGTGAISIAGQNNRFNRITVDGLSFGDPFGLEAGGLATARGPIPLDAIAEFNVQVAPVDIQQGNFQGGAIDTVLKSGTNRLGFTGFWSFTNDSLTGSKTRDRVLVNDFKSRIWGMQLTGPIIKDKLFFAVTYEQRDDQQPSLVGPAGEGFGNEIAVITRPLINQVQQISQSLYGFDPLDVARNVDEDDKKLVAKVDWNVSDNHRIAATYIYAEANLLAGQTPLSQASGPGPNFSPFLALQSNNYNQGAINHYGVLQWNADWSSAFSTQARFAYNDYVRLQVPFNGRDFGQFQVCLADQSTPPPLQCPPGTGRIQFGPDISRQANELAAQTMNIEFLARLRQNNHDVKFIVERRQQDFNNLFAQRVSGAWYFDSLADFQARRANEVDFASPIRGDIDTVRAIFTTTTWTFGVQDSWDVRPDLTFIYGFRYDLYEQPQRPEFNPDFLARFGFPNTSNLSGRGVFQPRFGLNWRVDDRLTLSGSAGIFAGGNPNVWISNNFSNPGPTLGRIQVRRVPGVGGAPDSFQILGLPGLTSAQVQALGAATLDNVAGGPGIPQELITLIRGTGSALAVTNALDPDFNIPSQWRIAGTANYRANLGPLGDDWRLGGDIVWSRVRDALTWTDLRSVPNTVQPTLPDGRPRYQPFSPASGNNQDVFLTNTDRGYSWNIVARVDKRWDSGLDFGFAYTFQRAKDENPGTSSVALSNYNNAASDDPNQAAYGTSIYQRDNAFRVNLGYQKAFFGDAETRIDLFFNSLAGQRFSYTFQDQTGQAGRSQLFGTTGNINRYLIYVPNVSSITADPIVSYANQATFEGLRDFILSSPLRDFQGQIAPKNLGRAPRFNKLDLSVAQEIPFVRGTKVEAFVDIENFLNMLNKDWGSLRQVAFPYFAPLVNVACTGPVSVTTPCPQYVYSNFREPVETNFTNISVWAMRFGIRLTY
ncbi:MAG: TonB-dependent receptor [Sphingomonadaceae bacterium]